MKSARLWLTQSSDQQNYSYEGHYNMRNYIKGSKH
uniref:Uncharacterized protein n=1 Tax=Trichinella nativa TaxID=6335 RepID=A0A0V1K3K2_9BILA